MPPVEPFSFQLAREMQGDCVAVSVEVKLDREHGRHLRAGGPPHLCARSSFQMGKSRCQQGHPRCGPPAIEVAEGPKGSPKINLSHSRPPCGHAVLSEQSRLVISLVVPHFRGTSDGTQRRQEEHAKNCDSPAAGAACRDPQRHSCSFSMLELEFCVLALLRLGFAWRASKSLALHRATPRKLSFPAH